MGEMTSRERIHCVLRGEIPDRVPYYEGSIDYPWICRLLNRKINGSENFDSGEYATNDIRDQIAVNQILHRDNMTCCCLPPIPADKRPGKDQILFFHDGTIKTWEDAEALEMPDVTTEDFQRPLRQFIDVCHAHDYAAVALTRCGISATYLAMGFEHFFTQLMDDPDLPEQLMKRYAEWTAGLIPVLADVGFDVVQTADDVCDQTGPLISPRMYAQRFWPHVRKIADAIKDTSLKWCFHSDGNLTQLLDDIVDLGVDVIHPIEDGCMDIVEVKKRFNGHPVAMGNVSMDLLGRGTPHQVEQCVLGLLRNVAPGGGYIFSSGNSIASYTLIENVKTMSDVNFQRGHYPLNL